MVDGVVKEEMVEMVFLDRRRTENISGVRATSLYPLLGAMLHLGCLHSTDTGILNRGIIF
jgi:hypothetical protein